MKRRLARADSQELFVVGTGDGLWPGDVFQPRRKRFCSTAMVRDMAAQNILNWATSGHLEPSGVDDMSDMESATEDGEGELLTPPNSLPQPAAFLKVPSSVPPLIFHDNLWGWCSAVCILWHSQHLPPRRGFCILPTYFFIGRIEALLAQTELSRSCIDLALLLLYRYRLTNPGGDCQPTSEVRVAVACLMTANKYLEDVSYSTRSWSRISGFRSKELVGMERLFLKGLNYNLHVTASEWSLWKYRIDSIVCNAYHLRC